MSCTLHIRCKRFGDFTMTVHEDHQIAVVKGFMEMERGIPGDKQTLTYDGLVLENSLFLKDYGIKDGSTLFLSLPLGFSKDIRVTITLPSGPPVHLWASENDPVIRLKEQLWRLCRLPVQSHELALGSALLKESQTLASCGLKDGSNLTVMRYVSTEITKILDALEIYIVNLMGKPHSFQVYPSDTIYNLKWSIQTKEGTPWYQQILKFEGKTLLDGMTLMDYNIQNRSTIRLSRRLIGA